MFGQQTTIDKQDQKSNRYDSISNNGYGRKMPYANSLTHSHNPHLEMLSHLKNQTYKKITRQTNLKNKVEIQKEKKTDIRKEKNQTEKLRADS